MGGIEKPENDALAERLRRLTHRRLVKWADKRWRDAPIEDVARLVENALNRSGQK